VGRLGSGPRLVGRIGSGVRVSVSFQHKYPPGSVLRCAMAAKNGGYDKGWLTSLRLRRIMSSPSQTLRRPLVGTTDDGRRGECSTLATVRRGFVFHTSRLVGLTTLDLYAAKPNIRPESRFLLPHLHSPAPLGGFPSEYRHPIRYEKTRMVGLPNGTKILKICLFVLT